MIKILFVCHGNICRSPMAEFVMKDLLLKNGREYEFEVSSAATSTEEIWNGIGNVMGLLYFGFIIAGDYILDIPPN